MGDGNGSAETTVSFSRIALRASVMTASASGSIPECNCTRVDDARTESAAASQTDTDTIAHRAAMTHGKVLMQTRRDENVREVMDAMLEREARGN